MTLQQQIEKLLLRHIHPDYAENRPDARTHIRDVASRITDAQAQAFATIHAESMKLVGNRAVRTRQVKFTSTGTPIGLAYYDRPIVTKRGSKEVMACLFPTRGYGNHLEFYFSGVGNDATNRAQSMEAMRFDVPVLRGIVLANPETTQWAINLLEAGYAHSQSYLA